MNSRALFPHGARRPSERQASRGFTLLEMCLVLFIMALLAAAALPAIQSAFEEEALRQDVRQLALMVRTATLQSNEQHRPYIIGLAAKQMSIRPATSNSDNAESESDINEISLLDPANKLLTPDPEKTNAWIAAPKQEWVFLPGELCALPRIRLSRGSAWIELSFNPLTGKVENETTYFP